MKYKVSILVAIGLIASLTTGYAAVQYYQLKNEKGEVLYQEKDISQFESNSKIVEETDPEMEKYDNKRWEIESSMEPGTAAALYITVHNPTKVIETSFNPYAFSTLADLRQKVGNQIFVPETLPGGFTFSDAALTFGIKEEFDKEALYKKAEQEKKEYVIQPLEWTNEMDMLFATYQSGESYINLTIKNYEGVEDSTTYVVGLDQQKKQVVKVGQIEVLYTEETKKDRIDKSIVWVTEISGKKIQYEISARGDKISKENIQPFLDALKITK